MIAQHATLEKEILITAADFDRLQELLESPRYRSTHAALLLALKNELDRGKVVPVDFVPTNLVTMRSQVRVHDIGHDERQTYTLVYPKEADIDAGKLSVLAPLGTALLGARVGQILRFHAPAGHRRLRLEQILYQSEAAGDLYL